jgi:hypothetical protein
VADTDVLWGGALTSIALDPIAWRLTAEVEVATGNASRLYTVVLDEVRELRANRTVPLPWSYAELTEVHVAPALGGLAVEFLLWADGTAVSVACSRITVTPNE